MKTTLKISLLLNLLLFITVIFLAIERPAVIVTSPAAEPQAASVPIPQFTESKPFRWNQLESTNYLIYVKNLRNIGCPEQTLHDIVVADVGQLYQKRTDQLRKAYSGSDAVLQAGLQKLETEKTAVIAYLLGTEPSPATPENSSQQPEATMPLVWQNIDPAKLNLDSGQIEALAELRQTFVDMIGGPNQDTASPDYFERWQKAQSYIDEQFAGAIGRKAFLDYESLANNSNPSAVNSGQ